MRELQLKIIKLLNKHKGKLTVADLTIMLNDERQTDAIHSLEEKELIDVKTEQIEGAFYITVSLSSKYHVLKEIQKKERRKRKNKK